MYNFFCIRLNQLPVSVSWWQHGCQICFENVYVEKNHKISNNATTTKAREEISTEIEAVKYMKLFDVCLTQFKNNQILLYKISR